jgi:hypothetical protein
MISRIGRVWRGAVCGWLLLLWTGATAGSAAVHTLKIASIWSGVQRASSCANAFRKSSTSSSAIHHEILRMRTCRIPSKDYLVGGL